MNKWMKALMALAMMLTALFGVGAHAGDFLEPEQAFQLQGELVDAHTVRLTWIIAPDYHLYRDRLSFNGGVGEPKLPDGLRKFDANFNKEMETYQNKLVVDLPVTGGAPFTLQVGYQGCA